MSIDRRRVVWTGALAGVVAGLLTVPPGAAAEESGYFEVAQQVANINLDGQSSPTHLTPLGGDLYFSAYSASSGRELWRSDGTAEGTVLVKDIDPGTGSGSVENITAAGGRLFFAADDGSHGFELWTSDGTSEGTRMVLDATTGSDGSYPSGFTALGDVVLYAAEDAENGEELWRSDGTAAGTWMVKDIQDTHYGTAPDLHPHSSEPGSFTRAGDAVFFVATDHVSGRELWRTDGTTAGTHLVHDIATGTDSSTPYGMTPVGNALYYSAQTDAEGRELWRTVVATGETSLVKDIDPGETWNGYPLHGVSGTPHFTDFNGVALFYAQDEAHGRELWSTDGTPGGTHMVEDLIPGSGDGAGLGDEPGALLAGSLLFPGTSTDEGAELWRSDGTSEGTLLVRDIIEGSYGPSPRELTRWQDAVYFSASDGQAGYELWRTDGTETGTAMVQDLYPGVVAGLPNQGEPRHLTAVGDVLYFTAESPDGRELWKLTREPVQVDTTAPETTITRGPSGTTTEAVVELTFVADEEASTFECRLDDATWTTCTSPHTLTDLSDGAHQFDVRATDPAGNTDPTPATQSFNVDTTAPETTITGGPSGTTTEPVPAFTFVADEEASTFECRLDDATWTSCTSPRTLTDLSEGAHQFDVRATDPAGNTDLTPATRSFALEPAAPPGPSEACLAARADLKEVKARLSTVKAKLENVKDALQRAKASGAGPAKIKRLKNRKARLERRLDNVREQRDELKRIVNRKCD